MAQMWKAKWKTDQAKPKELKTETGQVEGEEDEDKDEAVARPSHEPTSPSRNVRNGTR